MLGVSENTPAVDARQTINFITMRFAFKSSWVKLRKANGSRKQIGRHLVLYCASSDPKYYIIVFIFNIRMQQRRIQQRRMFRDEHMQSLEINYRLPTNICAVVCFSAFIRLTWNIQISNHCLVINKSGRICQTIVRIYIYQPAFQIVCTQLIMLLLARSIRLTSQNSAIADRMNKYM